VDPHVNRVPVVEPRPLQLGIVQRKAERFDEVQRRIGRRAQPGDVARIRRDLRLDQRDVKRQLLPSHL
jgi:hypothetical protein